MSLKEKAAEIERLAKREFELNKVEQNVRNEHERTLLRLNIRILTAEIDSAVASRSMALIDAYFNTGQMTAIRADGGRRNGAPVVTGKAIQDYWNARGEAERLACWSLEV